MGLHSGADEASVDAITLFVLLLCFCMVIGHLLEKNRWMTESITALALVSLAALHLAFDMIGTGTIINSQNIILASLLIFLYI